MSFLSPLALSLFALWIVYQGEYASRVHAIPFTTVQLMVVVVLVAVIAAAWRRAR